MKVELISYTKDVEKIVSAAAKLCYSSASIDGLMDDITQDDAERFVKMLSDLGHESPIEHVTFTFGIEGVSRAFLAQITRHRIASYSVQSQRYVKEVNFNYVTPPEIENDNETKKIYDELLYNIYNTYLKISDKLIQKHYEKFLKLGLDEKIAKSKAEKVAIEDARFVLPNACTTKLIVTMNARSLKNFFKLRCCNRAQWEIKSVADEMLKLVKNIAPTLFFNSGPECVRGICPEGKMSCGKFSEIRQYYLGK